MSAFQGVDDFAWWEHPNSWFVRNPCSGIIKVKERTNIKTVPSTVVPFFVCAFSIRCGKATTNRVNDGFKWLLLARYFWLGRRSWTQEKCSRLGWLVIGWQIQLLVHSTWCVVSICLIFLALGWEDNDPTTTNKQVNDVMMWDVW